MRMTIENWLIGASWFWLPLVVGVTWAVALWTPWPLACVPPAWVFVLADGISFSDLARPHLGRSNRRTLVMACRAVALRSYMEGFIDAAEGKGQEAIDEHIADHDKLVEESLS